MNDIYGFFIKNNMYIINPFVVNNIIVLKSLIIFCKIFF